ncbi:FecR family protein [Arenibacter certesii]|uniref:Anti-sigma factor n=1 Tax=Arenibacter certesii TaxID=228955 RepID=A0A918J438_9FLAO|nr:FecR domain-containing protein [Arenibacter certesii]GGW45896.1 anti-sigma factor [Arenibacter certesii]
MDQAAIEKYLSGEATEDEVEALFEWINADPINERRYIDFKKVWAITSESNQNKAQAWQLIQKSIDKHKKRAKIKLLKYAAIFIGILCGTYFYVIHNTIENSPIQHSQDSITLDIGNGQLEMIDGSGDKAIVDNNGQVIGMQKGDTLNYAVKTNINHTISDVNSKVEDLVYNEINVPYGKKIQVLLSDSTLVYLNAGSSLRFPVHFISGLERKVFLTGEAFFEVAKDKDPFIVNANNANIRALGTAFNVSAYSEEIDVETVLVEGSVGIYPNKEQFSKEHSTVLVPNQMAVWNKEKKDVIVKTVDVEMYTAWVSGKMVFRNTPFKVIRKKLERHYNIQIINHNRVLDKKTYNAVFDIETIREVMQTLDESFSIKYTIENNKLIIE